MAKKGIDISQWQGSNIDAKKVKASGIDFVIIRQGYRKTIDKHFLLNVKKFKDAGIPIHGVYHFAYALNKNDAIEEAKNCIKNVEAAGLSKDIIIFYDFEYDTVKNAKSKKVYLTKTNCIEFTNAFCDYVKSKGYKAGFYLNQDYYKNWYDTATIKKYIVWLADYNPTPHYDCTYQQYTSKGKVNGISGNVDMNYFYGEKEKETKISGTVNSSSTTAQDIIKTMQSWIGKSMAKQTHKDIIDIYNNHTPLAVGYKVKYTDDYCDTALSAAFIKNNAVDLIGGTECGVERHIQLFKKKGIWQEDGSVTPQPGWIITYNWDDGTQPNDGFADHIGIVEKVQGNTITTIEGNTGNGGVVARRTLKVANGNIRGYAIPKYANAAVAPKTEPKITPVKENTTNIKKLEATSKTKFTRTNAASPSRNCCFKAKVTANALYVRSWAGVEYNPLKSIPFIYKNKVIQVCDSIQAKNGTTWYYIRIDNKIYGFINYRYVQAI